MSSSSYIAVARNRLPLVESVPLPDACVDALECSTPRSMAHGASRDCAPDESPSEPPPSPPLHPAWRAALEAEDGSSSSFDLPSLWQDLVRGRLRIWEESFVPNRIVLLARVTDVGERLTDSDASLVVRVLSGHQQKVVACDLGIASSTGSSRYLRALGRLELSRHQVPLALVLAAQSTSSLGPVPAARSGVFNHQQNAYVFVSVRSPDTARMTQLTPAEQAIARCIISGDSRFEIARSRETSIHTVARQFHSIFEAMRVTGRYALIRRAVELRAFDE